MKQFKKKAITAVALGAALSLPVMSASAASVANVMSISSEWSNIVGGSNVSIANSDPTSSVDWGTGGTSGYDFTRAGVPISGIIPDGADFGLGEFVHRNQPINAGTAITQATLTMTIGGTITNGGSTPFSVTSTFIFDHDETPNRKPCYAGSATVCDDRVTAALNLGASEAIVIDGTNYYFAISGFEVGGVTFSDFLTAEGGNSAAQLVGNFTSDPITTVPIPAAAWLFGSGLIGLAGLKRRQRS